MSIENDLNRIANALEVIAGMCGQKPALPTINTDAVPEAVPEVVAKRGRPAKVKDEAPAVKPTATPNLGLDDDLVEESVAAPVAKQTKPAAIKSDKPITIENVRTAVAKHVNKYGTDSLKTIMAEFDAKKIVDVAVIDYGNIIERLEQ